MAKDMALLSGDTDDTRLLRFQRNLKFPESDDFFCDSNIFL
jgi:hypothetical protein